MVVGLKVRTPSAVQGVSVLILFPLTFVSSAYAPPETMPTWLQAFVNINPVTHVVDTLRDFMNNEATLSGVLTLVGMTAVIIAIFAPIALRIYNRIS